MRFERKGGEIKSFIGIGKGQVNRGWGKLCKEGETVSRGEVWGGILPMGRRWKGRGKWIWGG